MPYTFERVIDGPSGTFINADSVNPLQIAVEELSRRNLNAVVDYLADNTGATNTAAELQEAMDAASTLGVPLVIPVGTYRVDETLEPANDLEMLGFGAVFQCYITDLGDSSTMAPVININGKSNIRIAGIEIDGRQSAWAHTEWKPGINIEDSHHIWVTQVNSHDNKGDGISISDMSHDSVYSDITTYNNHIYVSDSNFDDNYRGGIFVGEGLHVYIERCTGRYATGTSPMMGIDIEPDADRSIVEDIEVRSCVFSFNGTAGDGAGAYVTTRTPSATQTATTGGSTTTIVKSGGGMTADQYMNCEVRWLTGNNRGKSAYVIDNTTTTITLDRTVSTTANGDTYILVPRQRDVRFIDCKIEENVIMGMLNYHSRGLIVRGSDIRNNGSAGIAIVGNAENHTYDSNTVEQNAGDQIRVGINFGGAGRTHSDIKIINNTVRGARDSGDGIDIGTNDVVTGLTLHGNSFTDVRYGLAVNGTLTGLKLGQNDFDGYTAAINGLTPTMIDNAKAIEYVIDGGGAVITTGVKGFIKLPANGWIIGHELTADQSGSIVIDLWRDTYANYPPVDADSITASAPPTLSSATKAQDSTLTGWNRSFTAGDYLGFNVDSASTVQRVTLALIYVEV